MKSQQNDECTNWCYFFLCLTAWFASVVFMFSAIILMSGYDHINNGITQTGDEMVFAGKVLVVCSMLYIMMTCVVVNNTFNKYAWAYVPSLLFSTATICFILANDGVKCGRCTRLYLSGVQGELDNTALVMSINVCQVVITSSPIYVFIIVLKNKIREQGDNLSVCECLCETIYFILMVFFPLFMIVLCCLTGGEGLDGCKLDTVGTYNGQVYNGSGVPMDSRLEMV